MSKDTKTEAEETQVTGMPPTPEKLTRLGAPVDERFATPEAAPKTEPKEDNAKRRSPKSEDDENDDPKDRSKRRR